MIQGTTTVFISYNNIEGYPSGWHKENRVFICANDNGKGAMTGDGQGPENRAGSVMHNISGQFYHGSVPVEQIKEYVVYAGINAMHQAIAMAKDLKARVSDIPVIVVSCKCKQDEKKKLLKGLDINVLPCECGGHKTMSRMVTDLLIN